MTDGKRTENRRLYLAVDIGGTKIQSSLVEESGAIIARERVRTPREGGSAEVLVALESAMQQVLSDPAVRPKGIAGIGVAVPGVVEPRTGRVVVTPNMNLTGVELGPHLEDRFRVPVAIGNDCNLGTLGEAWLGSARNAASVVGMFVGTGLGGGFVRKGKLWRGAREAAMEVGHTVMQIGGRLCGCGNKGCLEAVASRSAIERDIREGVAQGRPTAINEMLAGDLGQIRSGTLRKALEQGDELVTEVVHRAADVLGHACLTIRHILDPEVIVLGGGVVEACHAYILPIVEGIVAGD
ncbi:MAG: ROK family protein, partial [Thermoguttaceae bacterium]|nr:ROK family protein [Thermoguttaceae bacterium]